MRILDRVYMEHEERFLDAYVRRKAYDSDAVNEMTQEMRLRFLEGMQDELVPGEGNAISAIMRDVDNIDFNLKRCLPWQRDEVLNNSYDAGRSLSRALSFYWTRNDIFESIRQGISVRFLYFL